MYRTEAQWSASFHIRLKRLPQREEYLFEHLLNHQTASSPNLPSTGLVVRTARTITVWDLLSSLGPALPILTNINLGGRIFRSSLSTIFGVAPA